MTFATSGIGLPPAINMLPQGDVPPGFEQLPLAPLPAMPQGGMPVGFPQAAFPQGAFPQGAFPQAGFPQGAYPQGMFPQGGYPQMMYPQSTLPFGPVAGPQMALPVRGRRKARRTSPPMMLPGQAQGILGAEAMKPPSTIGTVIKSMLTTGLIGAVAGAGIGAIPFLPGGLVTGALIGGAAGALLGLVRGIGKAKHDKAQFEAITRSMQNGPVDPGALGPVIATRRTRKKSRKAGMHRSGAGSTYVVRSGDTLSAIAQRHHTTWQKLYAANRSEIGSNPSAIKVGARIVVPRGDRA